MMQVQLITRPVEDTLTIRPFEQGAGPENQEMFKGEKGEIWWYSSRELWLGLGKSPQLPAVIKIFRSLFFKRKDRWPDHIVLDAIGMSAGWIENAVNGIILGGYDLQLYKTDRKAVSNFFVSGTLYVMVD